MTELMVLWGWVVLLFISDLLVESAKSDFETESIFLTCKSSQILDLFNQTLPQNATPQFGGGISYRISNDPGLESAIPDFIIRSESAKNDLFSKFRLHCLYATKLWGDISLQMR